MEKLLETEQLPVEPLGLNARDTAALIGISETKFRQLRRAGAFDGLESPIPGLWSRSKVEAWMRGLAVARGGKRTA